MALIDTLTGCLSVVSCAHQHILPQNKEGTIRDGICIFQLNLHLNDCLIRTIPLQMWLKQ
jgi:hypothetical protein